jgi:ABC-type antimicrobial peptide transport system permease subunit
MLGREAGLPKALRIGGDPGVIAKSVRAAILEIDSTLPAYDIALLDDRLAAQDRPSLALTAVTALYSLAALFLSALGLFGVLAHSVSRRTQELGIRMALGAPRGEVLFMVLLEGVGLTTVGILAGLAGAWMLTRLMSSLLFDVSATDPAVYLSIPVMLLVVAIAACYFPARRATKVDPLVALRSE